MSNESEKSVDEKGTKQEDIQAHKPVIHAEKESEESVTGGAETAKSESRGSLSSLVIVFLMVIFVAVSAYLFFQTRELQMHLAKFESEHHQLQQVIQSGNQTNESQNQKIEDRVNALQQAITKSQKEQQGIVKLVENLAEEKPDSNLEWGLMEAEYLVIIAMQRLLLQADVPTAIAALNAADKRLEDLALPALIPVRRQITEDLNALKAVNQSDVTGPALYLADLLSRVESLPLRKQIVLTSNEQASEAESALGSADTWHWQQLPELVWGELKSLVVIKRNSDGKNAFILPEEEYFIYQNLKLELNNARMSVLLRDEQNLQTSVQLIKQWLNAYFAMDDAAVSNLVEGLEQMTVLKLNAELPDISSSLETLKAASRGYNKG